MRRPLHALAIGLLPILGWEAMGDARTSAGAATPVGGVVIEPSTEPLGLSGCTITPRSPEVHDGLVVAQAGVRCETGAGRRNVTVELWQLDGAGFWQPVPETDVTFATAPATAPAADGVAAASQPHGPDDISCRAAPRSVLHRYRTYVAAFGPEGEPRLHAGPVARLPFDCLAGMAAEHAAMLGIPPGSTRRERLPAAEFRDRPPACAAFLLSPRPVRPRDCPGLAAYAVGTPAP